MKKIKLFKNVRFIDLMILLMVVALLFIGSCGLKRMRINDQSQGDVEFIRNPSPEGVNSALLPQEPIENVLFYAGVRVTEEEDFYLTRSNGLGLYFIRNARRYNIPVEFLYRLAYLESSLGRLQRGKSNYDQSKDHGVLQLNDKYMHYFVERFYDGELDSFDPYDEGDNIQVGSAYLKSLFLRFGNWEEAFLAYRSGPTNVRSGNVGQDTKEYASIIIGVIKDSPLGRDLSGLEWF